MRSIRCAYKPVHTKFIERIVIYRAVRTALTEKTLHVMFLPVRIRVMWTGSRTPPVL